MRPVAADGHVCDVTAWTGHPALAGTGCTGLPPHIIWTEGTGPHTIMGADRSGLR